MTKGIFALFISLLLFGACHQEQESKERPKEGASTDDPDVFLEEGFLGLDADHNCLKISAVWECEKENDIRYYLNLSSRVMTSETEESCEFYIALNPDGRHKIFEYSHSEKRHCITKLKEHLDENLRGGLTCEKVIDRQELDSC